MSRIIIAIGGNSLGKVPKEMFEYLREAMKPVAEIIEKGNEVVITHGNGPQVGIIGSAIDQHTAANDIQLSHYVAMTQGYIGSNIEIALRNELNRKGISKNISTIITQVEVDPEDPAFSRPTKPIGEFYSKWEADEIAVKTGWTMMEDSGRGYRRVVPSPMPKSIMEYSAIKCLIDAGNIVVAAGGGGIPVFKTEKYKQLPAVIDKDFASEKLGELIDADTLILLTGVPNVFINWGTPDQQKLETITVDQAKKYCDDGMFGEGSMLPKIQAAIMFAEHGGKTIITDLEHINDAVSGKAGTVITP